MSPGRDYLGIEEEWMILSVDLACACAHWEDENSKYAESKENAGREAVEIGQALEQAKQELQDR